MIRTPSGDDVPSDVWSWTSLTSEEDTNSENKDYKQYRTRRKLRTGRERSRAFRKTKSQDEGLETILETSMVSCLESSCSAGTNTSQMPNGVNETVPASLQVAVSRRDCRPHKVEPEPSKIRNVSRWESCCPSDTTWLATMSEPDRSSTSPMSSLVKKHSRPSLPTRQQSL